MSIYFSHKTILAHCTHCGSFLLLINLFFSFFYSVKKDGILVCWLPLQKSMVKLRSLILLILQILWITYFNTHSCLIVIWAHGKYQHLFYGHSILLEWVATLIYDDDDDELHNSHEEGRWGPVWAFPSSFTCRVPLTIGD